MNGRVQKRLRVQLAETFRSRRVVGDRGCRGRQRQRFKDFESVLLLGGSVLAADLVLLQGEPDQEGEIVRVEQVGDGIVRSSDRVGVGSAQGEGGEERRVEQEGGVATAGRRGGRGGGRGLGNDEQIEEGVVQSVALTRLGARLPDLVAKGADDVFGGLGGCASGSGARRRRRRRRRSVGEQRVAGNGEAEAGERIPELQSLLQPGRGLREERSFEVGRI